MLIEVDKVNKTIIAKKRVESYTPIHTLNNEVGEQENYHKNISKTNRNSYWTIKRYIA